MTKARAMSSGCRVKTDDREADSFLAWPGPLGTAIFGFAR
jgi:hypothetical protein